jgi:hypothetical protein
MCKSMNHAELKAIISIANKLEWKSVDFETIIQMVRNQQALELDTVGECDDFEETLLSIALWDKDKIISTMYVSNYASLVMWGVELFKEDMGLDSEALNALWNWEACKMDFLASEYEEEEMAMYDAYCDKWENSYC